MLEPLAADPPPPGDAPQARPPARALPLVRRKAQALGTDALETAELLALLGARVPDGGVGDLTELSRRDPAELVRELGASRAGGWRVAAAFALARKLSAQRAFERAPVRGPGDVLRLLGDELRGEPRESFHVLLLDGKHRLKSRCVVSIGSLSTSIVHPREVFRPAVRAAAAAVICAHNHPSGDPEPSAEDVAVTQRLEQSGKLLGIPLLDHVVLGDGRYVSLRERLRF